TTSFVDVLKEKQYHFCLIDPEGDYADLDGAVVVGTAEQPPVIEEIIKLLSDYTQNVIVCLLAIDLDMRPVFFNELFPKIIELRKAKAHPHWIIIDETNHILPAEKESTFYSLPQALKNLWLITTEPQKVNKSIFNLINTVIAIGDKPEQTLQQFADMKKVSYKTQNIQSLEKGKAIVWDISSQQPQQIITTNSPKQISRRHIKKYASGNMNENSFYFTGAENKLGLKAYNVMVFTELAKGIDDETWMYHLKRNDYSKWFLNKLHDNELAGLSEKIENSEADTSTSKEEILKLIKSRYTEAG
ncbi:MAG TPA: haloacid dehalogenase, partial [Parafilimonas sp.]